MDVVGTLASLRHVLHDRVGEVLHRHRLKPHSAWTGERRQEETRAAENRILDARDRRDVEANRLLVHADVARVNAQCVASLKVVRDHLTMELDPGLALSL